MLTIPDELRSRDANTVEISVVKRLGDTLIDVSVQSSGAVTALFGPSGSGKTSVVNMVAGLLKPDRGRIAVGERVLFDSDSSVSIPTHKRRVGYVFQDSRLFPHMTVRKNLDYGRRMNGRKHDLANEERVVSLLEIGRLLDRSPGSLSGGEKQRVAIGRALLLKPELLLLDEPLASLDSDRKNEILPYLGRLRDSGIPMLYVSHAIEEVERIADTVVYLQKGSVVRTTTNDIVMAEVGARPWTEPK